MKRCVRTKRRFCKTEGIRTGLYAPKNKPGESERLEARKENNRIEVFEKKGRVWNQEHKWRYLLLIEGPPSPWHRREKEKMDGDTKTKDLVIGRSVYSYVSQLRKLNTR